MGHVRKAGSRRGTEEVPAAGLEGPEGAIYFVKDAAWGFSAPGRADHPGLCVWFAEEDRNAVFIKGVDAERVSIQAGVFIVEPTRATGLSKPTAFQLIPRAIPRRLVELMHKSPRLIGRIEPELLTRIRGELARVFGRGGGTREWRR